MRRGLAADRREAHLQIASGRVLVGGAPAAKAERMVDAAEAVILAAEPARFVSRGGEKLEAALDRFAIRVDGRRALDAGSSTGGFTDCLLQRGAASVVALDVGYGQLHERLRADARVCSHERTNLREADLVAMGAPFDLVVADLSFISLRTVATSLVEACGEGGTGVALVKPQFEARRAEADRGRGIISDPAVWRRVLVEVIAAFRACGASIMGVMVSPIRGSEGNVEFLLCWRADAGAPAQRFGVDDVAVDRVVAEARQVAG